jgi:hypothetical protein
VKKNSSDTIPSFQFYPNDWLGDMNLRMCSVATRGVWIDLLCIMHKSKKYGYLVQKESGKWSNMSPKTIQKLTGMTRKRIVNGLRELSKNDVIKYDDDGLMYSKRLVKDHRLRQIRMEVGKLGGNPNLVNQSDNQKSTPSSSSSSSSSPSTSNNPPIIPPWKNGKVSKEAKEIFDFWNIQGIVQHRDIEKFVPHINAKLKLFSVSEIKEAIKLYKIVLEGLEYFFKYRWGLEEFLNRKNGIDKFMPGSKPLENFRTNREKPDPVKEAIRRSHEE